MEKVEKREESIEIMNYEQWTYQLEASWMVLSADIPEIEIRVYSENTLYHKAIPLFTVRPNDQYATLPVFATTSLAGFLCDDLNCSRSDPVSSLVTRQRLFLNGSYGAKMRPVSIRPKRYFNNPHPHELLNCT